MFPEILQYLQVVTKICVNQETFACIEYYNSILNKTGVFSDPALFISRNLSAIFPV